jgi:molecular chaperone DnaK (HSP70)
MVSLIGGTTFIPQVRDAIATHFDRPLDVEADPQTAVARGAAFLGAMPTLLR